MEIHIKKGTGPPGEGDSQKLTVLT